MKVTLLDYGSNEEVIAEEMRTIPESFTAVPGFALRCHLDEISPAGDISKWSQTACETLTSLLAPNKTFYVVAKVRLFYCAAVCLLQNFIERV